MSVALPIGGVFALWVVDRTQYPILMLFAQEIGVDELSSQHNSHLGTMFPHQRCTAHLCEVPLVHLCYTVSKGGRVSIQLVPRHPLERQTATAYCILQQFHRDFGFGLECQFFWHSTGLALVTIRLAEPLFRQE